MSQSPNSDDDYEVDIAVAPPRRPRTPNPAVDEPIQSGEIELPRSLIIRSSVNPPFRDDATEPSHPPMAAIDAMRRPFGRLAWLVAAIAPTIAAIVLHYAEPAARAANEPSSTELPSVAQLVGSTIDNAAHAAQLRAEAIASSPMVRAGIQTDAPTMADMAKDQDVIFSLAAGERIEVFQTGEHAPVMLLHVPANTAPIVDATASAARFELVGSTMTVVVNVPVTTKPHGAAAGVIALAVPIELAMPVFQQLSGVTLVGFASPIALGGGPAATPSTKVEAPIHTTTKGPALSIHAVIAVAPFMANHVMTYAYYACLALAGLFLLMYLASVIIRR